MAQLKIFENLSHGSKLLKANRSLPTAMAVLSLMALAFGCGGPEPTRTVIITAAPSPTARATAASVSPTATTTAPPSTAVPAPGVTPTQAVVIDGTAAAPTVDAGHQTEPTAGPVADAQVVRATITPAATESHQPTPTLAPHSYSHVYSCPHSYICP